MRHIAKRLAVNSTMRITGDLLGSSASAHIGWQSNPAGEELLTTHCACGSYCVQRRACMCATHVACGCKCGNHWHACVCRWMYRLYPAGSVSTSSLSTGQHYSFSKTKRSCAQQCNPTNAPLCAKMQPNSTQLFKLLATLVKQWSNTYDNGQTAVKQSRWTTQQLSKLPSGGQWVEPQ